MDIKKISDRLNTKILDSELEHFVQDNINFIGLNLSSFSKVLLAQLYVFNEYFNFDITNIVNEIKYLEGIKNTTSTKEEAKFKNEPLKGIWHKHFFDARYIIKNIGAEFGLDNNGNKKLNELLSNYNFENYDENMNINIINKLIDNAFFKRGKENRLTGEWIVFIKEKNKNYYLTVTTHDEDDIALYQRIKKINDFKELDFYK